MDESDYWPHEPDLLAAAHIAVADPDGEPERRNGWITVGTITVLQVGMTVAPRRHLSIAQKQQLLLAAFWVWIHGAQGAQWRLTDCGDWETQLRVPEPSG